jgi:hypothetical protein
VLSSRLFGETFRAFVSVYVAVGVPIVAAFRSVELDGSVVTEDPKDADQVPPVAGRLSLALGFFL